MIYIVFLLLACSSYAQSESVDSTKIKAESDSLTPLLLKKKLRKVTPLLLKKKKPHKKRVPVLDSVNLDEVVIVAPFSFKSRSERHHYYVLRRKTKKVWPYAVLASKRLTTLRARLSTLHSNREKRAYIKIVQDYVEDQFKEKLKNLTHSEGQILIKLMYRQTGETTYDIIQDLRSGFRAFLYNITANLFTISLREKYDPYKVKDDYYIEHILRRAFQREQLEYQAPGIEIEFSKAIKKWN